MGAVSKLAVAAVTLLLTNLAFSQQLKLGKNPAVIEKSAVLELYSDNQGLLLPRIADTSLINVLTPPDGMIIYFTPTKQLLIHANGYWEPLALTGSVVTSLNGNTGALTMDTTYISNFYQKVRGLLNGGSGINYDANTGTISSSINTNNFWNITGNSGTNPSSNFIGTTDNQDLVFKTNNTENARIVASTGDLKIGSATTGTIRSTQELVLRQDGDTYGSSILRLRNRSGENGAIFETTDPSITLVDFIFKTAASQRNIRYEGRSSYAKAGTPSFEIGGSNPDNPTLAIGDTYAAFNTNLKIGNYNTPTEALDVTGNVRFSGALMPNNSAGTSGYVLQSNGNGTAPSWKNFTLANLNDVTISSPSNGQLLQYNGTNWVNTTPSYLTSIDTTNISNFYLKVRSLLSGGTGITYNNATGVITNSGVTSLNGNTGALTMDTSYISNFSTKVRSLHTVSSPLTYNNTTGLIGITQASSSTDGYLSSTDWNTFNSKLSSYSETDPVVKAINGIVKSNGTTISAAVAGTDYLAPFGSQTAKTFYAAPNASAGTPSFRAIVASDIPTLNQNTTGSAATLTTGRTISITGDLTYTSPAFNGSANVTAAGTLATVNANVGTFTAATITVNGKGLITAASNGTFDTTNISNFYSKVRSELSAGTGILYNNATGVITNSGVTSLNGNTGALTIDTSYISNFYTKVRSELSAGTGINYNASTGVISSSINTGNFWTLGGNTVGSTQNLGTIDNNVLPFITNNTERMRIDNYGRVGIGVTNPANPLVVKDTFEIRRTGSMSELLFSNTAGSGDFRIAGDGGDIFWQGGGGRVLQMGSYWTTVLSGDRRTTSLPSFVNGSSNTGVLVQGQRDASVPLAIQSNSGTQTANLTEWRNSSGTSLSVVDKSGNFGIGSLTPSEALDVTGNVRFSGALMPNNNAGTSGYVLQSNGSGTAPTWKNFTLANLNDVTVSSPSNGQILQYNGTNWINATSSYLTSIDTSNISNFYLKVRSLHSANAPITYNSTTGTIGITQATTSTDGYLSSTDWNTFNSKQTSGNYLVDPGANGILARTALNTTVGRTITGTTNRITITNGNGVSGNPTIDVGSDIVDKTVANTYTAGAKQTFDANGTSADIRLLGNTSDPSSLSAGDIWYNTTSNVFKGRFNTTTRQFATLDGTETLTNKTISGSSNTITNIPNSALSNSSITVSTGTTGTDVNISGSPVSLGGTVTLNIPTASSTNTGKLSSTDWNTFNSKQTALTFSTGLTNTSNTITNNLSTGISSSNQNIYGSTAASGTLTLNSTTNATKGKILFGSSAYDEANDKLVIGNTTAQQRLTIGGAAQEAISRDIRNGSLEIMGGTTEATGAYFQITGDQNTNSPYEGSAEFVIRNLTNSQFAMFSYDGASTWTQRFQLKGSSGDTWLTPNGGKISVGGITPTASLHLPAGTATANTAPLKFTSGTNLTTPEDGAVEYDGSHLYVTIGSTRYQLDQQSGASGLGDPGGNGIVARTALNTTVNRTITGTTNKISISNGNGVSGNPTIDVGSDIVDKTVANTYTAGAKQTFDANGTSADIRLLGNTSDPSSLSAGDIWYNTTSNVFKGRFNTTTRQFATLDGTETLTNKTISGSSNTITNIPNSALSNSSITVSTGTTGTDVNVSGSPVSLGGTVTLNIPTASSTNTGKLSSTDWSAFNSKQAALTFSTGLTNTSNTITNNLSTGVSGGQTVTGGTGAGNDLTLRSTSNATKGNINFGGSTYDENNDRLGVGTTSPGSTFSVNGSQEVSFVNVSGAYTILSTDYVVINTGSAATWTLPNPTTCSGRTYRLINHGSGTITLSRTVRYTSSATTTSLTNSSGNGQNSNHFIIMSDGTQWILIGS